MTVQQKLVKNNWFRLAVSVTLTLAVLVVFVFAPFNTAHAIVGVDDAVIVILIAGLASIGITFASTGAFNTLNEYVGSLLEECAADNNTTVFGLTNGVNASANAAGKLLLNNRFILLIDTFATWLKNKFSMANNGEYTLQSSEASLDNMTVYNLPLRLERSNGLYYEYLILLGAATEYALFEDDGTTFKVWIVSENDGTYRRIHGNSSGMTGYDDYELEEWPSGLYARGDIAYGTSSYDPNGVYTKYTQSEIYSALNGEGAISEGGVGINVNTGVINLPTDNLDYTAGDGAILDVGATWGRPYTGVVNGEIPAVWPQVVAGTVNPAITYEPEGVIEGQLPAPSEIENLPGGMTVFDPDNPNGDIGNIFNLRLNTIWHYVEQWISDFGVAGGLLWNTATALPNPVVNMVYAMVAIALVFGLIKIFRG